MSRIYATASQQPQRSQAFNSRGSNMNGSAVSNTSGSVNTRQFAQVRLRADLSVNSHQPMQQKRSPNRYNANMSSANPRAQQQTIQYNKNDSSSLVTENRNRGLIGNSLNRPHVQPIDSMSVGLNSNFANKARMQSINFSGQKQN